MKITHSGLSIPFTGIKKQYNTIRDEILDATDEVLRSGQLMNGIHTDKFEQWLAQRNHTKWAVTCHSGTQALEILVAWVDSMRPSIALSKTPRVLIPSTTYAATANAFARAGYEVVLLDTNYYGQADYEKLNTSLWYSVEVLIGMYGSALPADPHHGRAAVAIEDAAQHWLSKDCVRSRISVAAAISFDPMKNLANYGNGGAIVTDHSVLMDFARAWRDNGKPGHATTGTNSRMSETDCAQMMVKTRHIDAWQLRRAKIARYWMDQLQGTGIRSLIDETNFEDHAFHKFVVDTDHRDRLKNHLESHNIETRVHYAQPLHELTAYRDCVGPGILSGASSLSRRCLSLPLYPELTDSEVELVIDRVLDFASKKHNLPARPSRSFS